MKKKLPTILLCLSLFTFFAFKKGQEIELEAFLNARTNPNFLKYTKNIKTTLPKGTTGKVEDVKNFASGNAGIKMKITNGPRTGQVYWVYFDKQDPAIKLIDKESKKETTPEKIDDKKTVAETIRPTNALKDPDEEALTNAVKMALDGLKTIKKDFPPSIMRDCPPIMSSEKIEAPELKIEATVPMTLSTTIIEPERERPRPVDFEPGCIEQNNDTYKTCGVRQGLISGYEFINSGPNKIIPIADEGIYRKFSFDFPDRARSDMKLVLRDSPSGTNSHEMISVMLFFPRKTLPSIKEVDNEYLVTLPNGELIHFNKKTHEVTGGVFSEEKIARSSNGKAMADRLTYQGSGVVIKASKTGDLPYGNIEVGGREVPSTSIATVSKKGHKDCKIPSKDLWYNEPEKNNALIRPELASDAGLDSFLKKKCGFSIF